MCGIAGFILNKESSYNYYDVIKKMTSDLKNRGPDDEGFWKNENNTQFLGHRRLTILELSKKGSQPMLSKNSRYIISYNGEIYNHKNIRKKLNDEFNCIWETNSDTETVLTSIEKYGIKKSLETFHGMFAFAIIDKIEKKLYLARDLNGEKPLYYGFINDNFIFSSGLRSISYFPGFKKRINKHALKYYLDFSYVPEPFSIFENIKKLEKNSYLEFDLKKKQIIKIRKYNVEIQDQIFNLNYQSDYLSNLNNVLSNSVEISMTSDVEVGSFLSGGTDSSLITAIMQSISNRNIKTFSVAVEDRKYNEKQYSRAISKYLKTDHNEIEVTEKNFIEQAKIVSEIYEEPFGDSSQIPTSLISKFASSKVKVILSGDGADEFFGGYNRYIGIQKSSKYFKYLPYFIRNLLGKLLSLLPENFINLIELILIKLILSNTSSNRIYEKLVKLKSMLIHCKRQDDIYNLILKNFESESTTVLINQKNDFDKDIELKILSLINSSRENHENMMKIDQEFYLPNDILTKVDRASMYYSLETRMPFLNPNLIEFSKRIPKNLLLNNGKGKIILKDLLKKYIPKEYVDRPKMGFSVPIDNWLRGSLSTWAKDILDERKINKFGVLKSSKVKEMMQMHSKNKRNFGTQLWNIIVLQNWLNKYYD